MLPSAGNLVIRQSIKIPAPQQFCTENEMYHTNVKIFPFLLTEGNLSKSVKLHENNTVKHSGTFSLHDSF